MSVEPTATGGARLVGAGVAIELAGSTVAQIAALQAARPQVATEAIDVLPDDHPMWDHHSGGNRHGGHPWTLPGDIAGARQVRRHVGGMACGTFFEMLLSQPGRLFTSEEIVAAHPECFSSVRAVAGCLAGFVKPTEELGRPFPFFWWEGVNGAASRYAVRPSVATVFAAAGE